MKTRVLFLLTVLFFTTATFGQTWQRMYQCLGAEGNSVSASMQFIENTMYIAFQDGDLGYKASVIKKSATGNNFVAVGNAGFTAGSADNLSTAVFNNQLYVAYVDAGNSGKASVMKYNGSNWVYVGSAGFSTGSAQLTTMAFIGNVPHVAFKDVANGNKATVLKFDGSNWIAVGSTGFSTGVVADIQLATDGTNPYVIYSDNSDGGKCTVKKFDGVGWVAVGSENFSTGAALSPKIAFNNTAPFVAFNDGSANNKVTVMTFNGTDWVNVGLPGFTFGETQQIGLAMHDNLPYVAYRDMSNCGTGQGIRISAMRFDGTNWVSYGNSCFSSTAINVYNTLYGFKFHNNIPYVVSSALCVGLDTKIDVFTYDENLSIPENKIEILSAAPNPFTDRIKINGLSDLQYPFEIIDLLGKKVTSGFLTDKDSELHLPELPKGLYLLKIVSDSEWKSIKILKN